jgi:hypothetical protein
MSNHRAWLHSSLRIRERGLSENDRRSRLPFAAREDAVPDGSDLNRPFDGARRHSCPSTSQGIANVSVFQIAGTEVFLALMRDLKTLRRFQRPASRQKGELGVDRNPTHGQISGAPRQRSGSFLIGWVSLTRRVPSFRVRPAEEIRPLRDRTG